MMSMGRANPTEALAPRTSANRNTEIMEAPEKPALEIPIQNAARESRHHELISVTMVSGMIKSVHYSCLLYTSPSPRDQRGSRMPSSA